MRNKCIEAGIGEILLYVGGNLVVGKTDLNATNEKFLNMGYDRVYAPGTLPDEVVNDLKNDLREKGINVE